MLVELQSRHARLIRCVHVVGTESQNTVHTAEVHADSAVNGNDSTLDRRAGAERDDRHVMFMAQSRDGSDLLTRQ